MVEADGMLEFGPIRRARQRTVELLTGSIANGHSWQSRAADTLASSSKLDKREEKPRQLPSQETDGAEAHASILRWNLRG